MQDPDFLMPEPNLLDKSRRVSTRNRSSSLRRTNDVQPSSSVCNQSPTSRRLFIATKARSLTSRGRTSVQSRSSIAASTPEPTTTQTNQRYRNWRIRPFEDKDHSGYAPRPIATSVTPLEYFKTYFDDKFFENAAICTNIYYLTKTGKVINTTAAEFKRFFGVLLVMGCVSYPRIHMYWRQGKV